MSHETAATALAITATAHRTDRNPAMPDSDNMDHWKVTLRCKDGDQRRSLTTVFSMGMGHNGREPTADEVMECLLSDAATIENARDFADFCSELGYDEDSRKAERIYRTCQRQTAKLHKFLGTAFDDAVFPVEAPNA